MKTSFNVVSTRNRINNIINNNFGNLYEPVGFCYKTNKMFFSPKFWNTEKDIPVYTSCLCCKGKKVGKTILK